MKKHLIALAVASAVAAPAMAQNVSVSGTIDANYGSFDSGSTDTQSVGKNGVGTTAIKFTGSEDLGGGLKVAFVINQEFDPGNGQRVDASDSSAGIDESSFQEASLALSGAFGSVKVGHFTLSNRDAGGVGRFTGNHGRLSSTWRTTGDKVDNAVEYTTPVIAGFQFAIGQADGGTETRAAATPQDTSFFVKYAAGALTAAAGQGVRDTGAASDEKESQLGVAYDLGMAKVGLVIAKETIGTAKKDATVVAVSVPLGNGLTLGGSVHNYKTKSTAGDKANGYELILQKAMSKRTTVYAGYESIKNKGAATYKFGQISDGVAGATTSAAVVGITHNF